ncbi:hypothetical protein DFH06DRAFT_1210098 [Mycena polygramma]|nr:hypothetical protein DFH06DRAFT_1210098 [Mycena polygramma]
MVPLAPEPERDTASTESVIAPETAEAVAALAQDTASVPNTARTLPVPGAAAGVHPARVPREAVPHRARADEGPVHRHEVHPLPAVLVNKLDLEPQRYARAVELLNLLIIREIVVLARVERTNRPAPPPSPPHSRGRRRCSVERRGTGSSVKNTPSASPAAETPPWKTTAQRRTQTKNREQRRKRPYSHPLPHPRPRPSRHRHRCCPAPSWRTKAKRRTQRKNRE